MNIAKYLLTSICAVLCAACSEPDAFYTAVYPVSRVETQVEIAAADGETETPDNPLAETIRAELSAASPVEAGGSYTLRFTRYNGGELEVVPTPGAEALTGAFLKQPGTSSLQLVYGGQFRTYALDSYVSDGVSYAVLRLDLTADFQSRYPDAGIVQAIRQEYTTARF